MEFSGGGNLANGMTVNDNWLWALYVACCVPSVVLWTRDRLRRTAPGSPRTAFALAWADGVMFGIGTGLGVAFAVLLVDCVAYLLLH